MRSRLTITAAVTAATLACAPASGAQPSGDVRDTDVVVALDDIRYEPTVIEVPAGEVVTLALDNVGGIVHDLVTDDWASGEVRPGQTIRFEVGPLTSSVVAWCSIPGHRDAGMELEIRVTGSS